MNPLQTAISLSEKILIVIDNLELDKIEEIDQERVKIIKNYFSTYASSVDVNLLLTLKNLNDIIVERLREVRVNTRSQLSQVNKAYKASKAYLDNSSK